MKKYRLNRMFNKESNRCLNVAIDHGFFNEIGFLKSIENLQSAVETVAVAGPDCIQLTAGQSHYLQSLPGKGKPSLVMRTDIANVYGKELPSHLFSRMIDDPITQAINQDASCVVVNLFQIPGQPIVTDHCIQNILKIKPLCDTYSMPLMIEPLVFQPNEKAGGYMVDGNLDKILPLVRQAVELGADIIKADPTDNVGEYNKVVEIAGKIPVMVRGGGKVSDLEILNRTKAMIEQGVSGIVYGRNIIQHKNPAAITKALMGIVHYDFSIDQALELLN
ncbi:class I fructose-bisphosphate aldolase [Allomuricauda sp. CP2A]|mgnify:CR=1 FL=1|jgi:DhnA family fructose-bisphosphate aldolase class Ia|uniref:class I fructose-bisphosphate aldolase n=1 Tax=Allomuricauda sp. CP2A TaxID=1848189 RepID=UPI00082FFE35|nr:aldolase [Muricauda sp. CP2A]